MICAVSYPAVRVNKVNNINFKGYYTLEEIKAICTNVNKNELSKKLHCLCMTYIVYGKTQREAAIQTVRDIKVFYEKEEAQKALPHGWSSMIDNCNIALKALGVKQ